MREYNGQSKSVPPQESGLEKYDQFYSKIVKALEPYIERNMSVNVLYIVASKVKLSADQKVILAKTKIETI